MTTPTPDSLSKIADEMVNWTWTADRTPTVVMHDWAERLRALPSHAELERDAGRYRLMAEHAEAKFQRAVRILTAIHSLLHPPLVTAPDGRTFAFKSPMLDEQVQALSDRIRAIPDELAAIDAARAKEGKP